MPRQQGNQPGFGIRYNPGVQDVSGQLFANGLERGMASLADTVKDMSAQRKDRKQKAKSADMMVSSFPEILPDGMSPEDFSELGTRDKALMVDGFREMFAMKKQHAAGQREQDALDLKAIAAKNQAGFSKAFGELSDKSAPQNRAPVDWRMSGGPPGFQGQQPPNSIAGPAPTQADLMGLAAQFGLLTPDLASRMMPAAPDPLDQKTKAAQLEALMLKALAAKNSAGYNKAVGELYANSAPPGRAPVDWRMSGGLPGSQGQPAPNSIPRPAPTQADLMGLAAQFGLLTPDLSSRMMSARKPAFAAKEVGMPRPIPGMDGFSFVPLSTESGQIVSRRPAAPGTEIKKLFLLRDELEAQGETERLSMVDRLIERKVNGEDPSPKDLALIAALNAIIGTPGGGKVLKYNPKTGTVE